MEPSRCSLHGLIIHDSAPCVRCRRDEERTATARVYTLLGAGAAFVLLLLGGFRVVAMLTSNKATASRDVPASVPASQAEAGPVVVVYTTSHCPWCKKAKIWLDTHEVAYTERNVEDDREAAAEMRRIAPGGGVPTIVVDGVVGRGYSPQWLEKTLASRR
jgi:glutaredoxin